MLKKLTLIVIGLILCVASADAQRRSTTKDKDEKWTERIVFGGGIGVGYTNGWNINVTPNVGYKITDRFWAGIGVDYYYVSFRLNSNNKDRFSVVGPKTYALYYITPEINLGTEFAHYFYTRNIITNGISQKIKEEQDSWLLGGGYTQRLGGRAGIRLELYYDVLYDETDQIRFRNSAFVPRINIVYGF